jgi:hypothetical protein
MTKPTAAGASLDELALYEKLVATHPEVEGKRDTVPYTSVNGHMFSYLSNGRKLALRLLETEPEAFLKKYKAKLCQAYGVVQREYVEVPDFFTASTRELKPYFALSYNVSSLKLKPTTKKKGRPSRSNGPRPNNGPLIAIAPPDCRISCSFVAVAGPSATHSVS